MGYKEFSSIMRHHQAPLKPCKEWLHSSSIAMLIIQFPDTRLRQKYVHDSKSLDFIRSR